MKRFCRPATTELGNHVTLAGNVINSKRFKAVINYEPKTPLARKGVSGVDFNEYQFDNRLADFKLIRARSITLQQQYSLLNANTTALAEINDSCDISMRFHRQSILPPSGENFFPRRRH